MRFKSVFFSISLIWVVIINIFGKLLYMEIWMLFAVQVIPLIISVVISSNRKEYLKPNGLYFAGVVMIIFQLLANRHNIMPCISLCFVTGLIVMIIQKEKIASLKYIAIIIFLLNCGVSYYEYANNVNLLSYDMSLNQLRRFRSTGLWEHPLYSALINASCMLFFIESRLNKYIKLTLYFIGLYVLFLYDARTSTIYAITGTAILLFWKGKISISNLILLGMVSVLFSQFYEYLSTSDLGGKLFDPETNKFQDVDARMLPFTLFAEATFNDLFWGIGIEKQVFLANRYGLPSVENSFIALVFFYGFIPAFLVISNLIKSFFQTMNNVSVRERYVILGGFLITGMTSQALTSPYVWYTFIIFFAAFTQKSIKI